MKSREFKIDLAGDRRLYDDSVHRSTADDDGGISRLPSRFTSRAVPVATAC